MVLSEPCSGENELVKKMSKFHQQKVNLHSSSLSQQAMTARFKRVLYRSLCHAVSSHHLQAAFSTFVGFSSKLTFPLRSSQTSWSTKSLKKLGPHKSGIEMVRSKICKFCKLWVNHLILNSLVLQYAVCVYCQLIKLERLIVSVHLFNSFCCI